MSKLPARRLRCAIYTRKSSEEGLEQEFNSLDAQREACTSYITSQRSEGWVMLVSRYDDGGVSGGTLDRPALKRLLADIEQRLVDVVVVYKIDRLSRALMDFAKLVEVFDRNNVTFVSVTQSFNTTTSMGRLTLNVLLSFAQFEREVIGERIRDKIAASRKRGMWMGGVVPLGYQVRDRKLVIDETGSSDRSHDLRTVPGTRLNRPARQVDRRCRHSRPTRQVTEQRVAIQTTGEQNLHRRRHAQGRGLPRATRADHQPDGMGQGPIRSAAKPPSQGGSNTSCNSGIAEGLDLRADRHGHEPNPYPPWQSDFIGTTSAKPY